MSDTSVSGSDMTTVLYKCARCGLQQAFPTNWWLAVQDGRRLMIVPLADWRRFISDGSISHALCGDCCLMAEVSEFAGRVK